MSAYILIGILGGVASVVSLAIAAPGAKSRIIHVLYGLVLTVIVGGAVLHNQEQERKIHESNLISQKAEKEISQLKSIQSHAQAVLASKREFSTTDIGKNRGFILSAFAFIETHRQYFPESYAIAKKLVEDGLRITESAGSVGSEGYFDERKRLEDGAATMRQLLKGISGNEGALQRN